MTFKNKAINVLTGSILLLAAQQASADSYDRAVNLYLKGFDMCSSARQALSNNRLSTAKGDFKRYVSIRDQAVSIDASILNSDKRGMDSNLKYCKRVGTDIELAEGTPLLEQALAICDQAHDALKDGKPEHASQMLEQYIQQKDHALSVAPALLGVFSLKNYMRRCDRLDRKIARISDQKAKVAELLDSAREESKTYTQACNSAIKEFASAPVESKKFDGARKTIAKLSNYSASSQEYYTRYKSEVGAAEKDAQVDSNLKKGNQCLTQFKKQLQRDESAFNKAIAELTQKRNRLVQANSNCSGISSLAKQGPSQQRYEYAKKQYETARRARNGVQSELSSNAFYNANNDGAEAGKLNQAMLELNRCLNTAKPEVAGLKPAPKPVVKAPVAVPVKPAVAVASAASNAAVTTTSTAPLALAKSPANELPKPSKVAPTPRTKPVAVAKVAAPSNSVSATIEVNGITPDFGLMYWNDGGAPQATDRVEIYPTGFNKKLVHLPENGKIRFRNSDFSSHELNAQHQLTEFDQTIGRLGPKQMRSFKIKAPNNTLITLRSNKDRVVPTHLLRATSSDLMEFEFSENDSTNLRLQNPKKSKRGYLLIPDFDPLQFEVSSGEEKTYTLSRNKNPMGKVVLKGM